MRKVAQTYQWKSGSTTSRQSDVPDPRTSSEPYSRNSVNPHSRKAVSEERVALTAFHALPGPMAVRDAQELMAYPFFSLAKTKRVAPIHFRAGNLAIDVEATSQFGMATIWDADVLIWAASQLVEARDRGLPTSRLMVVTPYEILMFGRRGTSVRAYHRLKAALDRLQSTSIATSIRQPNERRLHRFSWINEWTERADASGRPLGIELVLTDWFYRGLLDDGLSSPLMRNTSSSRAVSSGGCIGWSESMPVDSRPDGGLISGICTPSPEAAPPTAISRSIYEP